VTPPTPGSTAPPAPDVAPAVESAPPVAPDPAPAAVAPSAPPPGVSSPEAATESDGSEPRGASLYIRLAAGFGFPFGPDVADGYANRDGETLHFSGYSFAMDWMAGSAVTPGLVLGLGMASDTVVGGTVRDGDEQERGLDDSLYYAVIGGFADLYMSPPAGLHFQALLGLGRLSRSDDLGENTATGFGAVLGVGYDIAVGRRWNVGVLGRMAFSPLSMDAVDGETPSPTMYEPSLLWTATFRPEQE